MNLIKVVCGFVSCLLIGWGCRSVNYEDLDVKDFAAYIRQDGVQLVDVRTPEEYGEGHLKGALLVDFRQPDFSERAQAQLDRQLPVAVYCRSGRRSAAAAEILSKAGYKVTNLRGGFLEWQNMSMPFTVE